MTCLNAVLYLDRGRLRCGDSQQHLGHLVDHQLCDQLFIFLHVLADQRHGAVHHLERQKNSQSASRRAVSVRSPTQKHRAFSHPPLDGGVASVIMKIRHAQAPNDVSDNGLCGVLPETMSHFKILDNVSY